MSPNDKEKGFLDDVVKKQKRSNNKITNTSYNKKNAMEGSRQDNSNDLKALAYGKNNFEKKHIDKPSITKQIRIASNMEQSILKFISYANGYARSYSMARYISRKFSLSLEDQDGNEITDKTQASALLNDWSVMYFDERKNSRDVAHLMFSAPHGTDRKTFKKAVRSFLHEQYHGNHDYVFTAHKDTEHPHVHTMLCMRSIQGKKLDPRKKYIHGLRSAFAKKCREYGIMVDASYRFERGLSGNSLNSKMYQMRNKRQHTPESDIKMIQKIKKELNKNVKNDAFVSTKKQNMKQYFYDSAKNLYEQAKVSKNSKESESTIRAAKLLYDFTKHFDEKKDRYSSIKTVVRDIGKGAPKLSKEAAAIIDRDIEETL